MRLVWIYPDLLSTYGDRGNLLVLARRARLRGIPVEIAEINSDQRVPADGDIYLLGGGEDLPQILAARRLRASGGMSTAVSRGAVVLAVCAGYQIVGTEFGGAEGEPVPGLGLLDVRSGRGERRGVGEITADADPALGVQRLTGFENHQGTTWRGPEVKPLATVLTGVGNGDGTEGAYSGRVVGTYLHGPALVRNPSLADLLLGWVVGPLPPADPAGRTGAEPAPRAHGRSRRYRILRESRILHVAGKRASWRSLVDQGLGAFGHDLGHEGRGAGDPDAADQVAGLDVPAGGALGAHRHGPRGQDPGQQVGQRRGVREREVLRAARQPEPRGLAGQPQRHAHPAGHRRRGDGEGLITPFRVVLPGRDLDDKRALGHGGNSSLGRWGRIGRGCGAARDRAPGPALHLRPMHGMLSAAILICVFAAVTVACLYVAGRVYLAAGRRRSRRGDSS